MDSETILRVHASFHTTLHFHATYTGRSQYHSDIEQCEVAQNIDVHGSRGKKEEEVEGAVRSTSVYAVSLMEV